MDKSLYKVMMLSVVSMLGITTSYGSITAPDDMMTPTKPILRSGGVSASPMMETDLLKSSNPTAATTQSSHGDMTMQSEESDNSFIYYFHKVHYGALYYFHKAHYAVRDSMSALFSRTLGWVWPKSN